MSTPFATGGCQCGAVRYALDARPVTAEFCHCRMCQRAVGQVSAGFFDVDRRSFRWLTAPPANYRSSEAAQRGFCARCGTPLTFDGFDEPTMALSIASLDDPELVPMGGHCGIQSKVGWLRLNDGLPQRATGEGVPAAPLWSHLEKDEA
ncbi:MAG: GFA family protein [Brevundimonas sp.]|nr:GFA family protein [Brevundimonas sp.]